MKIVRFDLQPRPAPDFDATIDWRVMAMAEVDAELKTLERALGGAVKIRPRDIDLDEEEWEQFMTALIGHLAMTDETAVALPALSAIQRQALGSRIGQARRALKYAGSLAPDGAGQTTTVLMPARYALRCEYLLAYGQMPVA